ncbi:MAG TPA: shikimate dehydrogenase [Dehalococcoidia bacterium]|nr:shikimate dehydrogenase [Dehalococcoidia bacterium]
MVSGNTRVCCLIGDPVAHSLSPLVHNAGYQALGIDFIYVSFQARDIKPAIEAIRGLGIRGASITVPHKITAMPYLDHVDDEAREIGAVNTVVNNNGVLTGYNSDGTGARQALEEVTTLAGKKAVLIGSGGGAVAIAAALKKSGTRLVILNRTVEKARHLAKMVNADDFGDLDKLTAVSSADILINATQVGMWPGVSESVIPRELLHQRLTVFDIVYNPRETRLLTEAKEKGCPVVYGYRMLLYQAARQFELFTGHQAPLPVMEHALIEALG